MLLLNYWNKKIKVKYRKNININIKDIKIQNINI